jgi:hypothetical protein
MEWKTSRVGNHSMLKTQPDIISTVRFLRTDEGGRKTPIYGGEIYQCPVLLNGHFFDCGLLLYDFNIAINPGGSIVVPMRFLLPDIVKPQLKLGTKFQLWEGKTIAEGKVIEIL